MRLSDLVCIRLEDEYIHYYKFFDVTVDFFTLKQDINIIRGTVLEKSNRVTFGQTQRGICVRLIWTS